MTFRSISILIFSLFSISVKAQFKLDIEGGAIFGTNYNKVRIPNTGGTLVNLADELSINPKIFYRIRAGYTIGKRHTISVLYAPLTVKYNGSFNQNINFNNLIYTAGQPLNVFYKFNTGSPIVMT